MKNNVNFQQKLDEKLEEITRSNQTPTLLLHVCCAPCSVQQFPLQNPVEICVGEYCPEEFLEMAKGLEQEPEGGSRCYRCYEQRLRKTAQLCREGAYDYFTTTLSISPYKRADWLNEIGERLADEYGLTYLVSDFKKKNGYRRSIELSREYQLYRQDYCGCVYSKAERDRRVQEKNKKC